MQPIHARARRVLCVLVLLAPAGCVTGLEEEPTDEPSVNHLAINADCPNFGCGSNSPVVGWPPFHELDEGSPPEAARARSRASAPLDDEEELDQRGQFNAEGLRVVHIRSGFNEYRLDVEGDKLRALDEDGNVELEGAELVASVIVLEKEEDDGTTTRFDVFIEHHSSSLTFWIGADGDDEDKEEDRIDTYRLTWATANEPGPRQPVCPLPADYDEWGPVAHEAIFFQGDRYDAVTKDVIGTGGETQGWFNVGCAGSATAKMHLNRHTEAGSSDDYTATTLERQALLKMFVSDYCGTGTAFTEVGEPLRWENSRDWQLLGLDDPIDHEAVWDHTGALCLDTPRMGDTEREITETRDAIRTVCKLPPRCSGSRRPSLDTWKTWGYLLTANP